MLKTTLTDSSFQSRYCLLYFDHDKQLTVLARYIIKLYQASKSKTDRMKIVLPVQMLTYNKGCNSINYKKKRFHMF